MPSESVGAFLGMFFQGFGDASFHHWVVIFWTLFYGIQTFERSNQLLDGVVFFFREVRQRRRINWRSVRIPKTEAVFCCASGFTQ